MKISVLTSSAGTIFRRCFGHTARALGLIGRIKGKLLSKQPPELLVDVHGVGYEMEAPMSTFYQLPVVGEEVVLHTHMVVREDAQLLYAFASIGERQLFRDLIRINGVGPKLGLTILSTLNLI